jgi:hypothetical protein
MTSTEPVTTTATVDDGINEFVHGVSATTEAEWTDANEQTLKELLTKAQFYNSLYNESFYYYNRLNVALNIILILFTIGLAQIQTITTALSFVNSDVQRGLLIASTACTVVVGIVGGMQKQFNANVKASSAKILAQQFMAFVNKVNNLLSINKTYRVNPDYTLMQFGDDYQKLIDQTTSNIIPQSVMNKVLKASGQSPIIVNGVNITALERVGNAVNLLDTKIVSLRSDADGILLNSV